MRQIAKYPGAKWAMAPWIVSLLPAHHSYLEPFFGSGAVLFTKPRSNIETINDMDGEVVNLFEWIKTDPERLAREVYLTPYARQIYDEAYAVPARDSFDRAVKFYIRLMMGHGFRTTGEKVGWKNDVQGRERSYAAKHWCDLPELIIEAAERLRMVQIECRPAQELIPRFNFPNVLIYADPPYMLGTRHGKQYRCEMTDADHERLLHVLLQQKGSVMVSGYESGMYSDALKGWHRAERKSRTQTARARTEVLWMNFEPSGQESIFPPVATTGGHSRTYGKRDEF